MQWFKLPSKIYFEKNSLLYLTQMEKIEPYQGHKLTLRVQHFPFASSTIESSFQSKFLMVI
jgi:hypothetical protein